MPNTTFSVVRREFKKVIGKFKLHFYLADLKYVEVNERDIQHPKSNS